jgi:prepilin peptidase CpaA
MNLMALVPIWLAVLLCLTLAAAAVEDSIRLRISNLIVVAVLAEAVVAMFVHGVTFALWENLALFIAFLLVGTALFSAGMLGGGDVKLLAAVGLWVDFEHAPFLIASVFIAGGLLAVVMLSSRLLLRRGSGGALRDRSRRIPYAVAIATGSLFLLALQHVPAKQPNSLEIHPLRELPESPR